MQVRRERTDEATKLKVELIKELMNKEIEFVAVINYYYKIQDLNR